MVEFLSRLTEAQFEDRRRKLEAVPKSLFLDETDTLTLLRATVLVTAGDPAGLLIPTILPGNAIPEAFLLSVFGYLRGYFAINLGSKIEREVHGRSVIHCDTPAQSLISLVGSGKSGGMVFGKVITNFVHIGHEK